MNTEIVVNGQVKTKEEYFQERIHLMNEDAHKPAEWHRFMGNNHNTIENKYGQRWGGGFSVREHLDKPLSEKLWFDLVYRFGIAHMRIYRPNDAQWCIAVSYPGVDIHLDENDNVRDFHFNK